MPTHFVLRKKQVQRDWKLHLQPKEKNNGRKVIVNEVYADRETAAESPEWEPGPEQGKTAVVATGRGGLEVATFTEAAGQVYHKHLLATEIYIVLEGTLCMRMEGKELRLQAGDEVVVFPNTAHEIVTAGTDFLARVHVINCHGERDKYVSINGEWCQLYTLKKLGLSGKAV